MSEELFTAISDHDHDEMRRLLSAEPALAESSNDAGVSAVLHAAYQSNDEAIRALLSLRPSLSAHEAAATGATEHVDGAEHDHSTDGWTPLHLASYFGHTAAVERLLEGGADVHARSRNDLANHPLHAAAAGGHLEVCRVLIGHGADVNARQSGGSTPLHAAAQRGDSALVSVLVDSGADPSAAMDDGRTAADLAREQNHEHVVDRLTGDGPRLEGG